MHLTFSRILAVAFMVSTPVAGSQITIRIYDYAKTEPRLLQRARQQAAQILERAGVASLWEKCRTSEEETEQDASCAQRAGAAVIQLRVYPPNMAKKIATAGIQFGFSLPSDRGFGVIAGVYLDRTLDFAQLMGLDAEMVLGHTMAHEIGHLLLGSKSHASQGIMRPTWDQRDIHLAKTGVLGFTDAQAERMQAQVAARLLLLGSPPVLAIQLAPHTPRPLTLRIYDHAKIDPHILRQSQNRTAGIFRQFGIEIGWLDCPTSPQQFPANLACQAPLGPTDFVVRILPESMSKQPGLPKGVFGYTLPTNKGRIGRTANIFYARVFDMAFYGPVAGGFENAQGVILGNVIAHEIGHLLLGPGSHSETGIMSFPWGRKQLLDASRGLLLFTPEQARNIVSKLDDLFAEGGDSVEGDP